MTENGGSLCRDCLLWIDRCTDGGRCPSCGSPRLIAHLELGDLSIAHVDCDAFYAAVEKRDNPELADRPVIIGGGRRGVVATACYIARIRGVRSAMPMFKALAACPDAVVIRPDMAKYVRVGRDVRTLMLELTPAVEPLSIDEAFLDLSGTERLHGARPALTLARFQRRVENEIGVTVSVGLSHNKFLAKIASDLDKPRGFSVIGQAETRAFLAARPISLIWGVGTAMQARLARDGLSRIGQLQEVDEATLAKRYGSLGLRLARLSRGDDRRAVRPERETKSISAETTFDANLADAQTLVPVLRRLSEKVSERMKAQGFSGRTIVLKLKSADFRVRTRNASLDRPTNLADRIFRTAQALLLKEVDGTRYRLIGVGLSDLTEGSTDDGDDLIDAGAGKRAKAEHAMNAIRERYGTDGLSLGLTFRARPRST